MGTGSSSIRKAGHEIGQRPGSVRMTQDLKVRGGARALRREAREETTAELCSCRDVGLVRGGAVRRPTALACGERAVGRDSSGAALASARADGPGGSAVGRKMGPGRARPGPSPNAHAPVGAALGAEGPGCWAGLGREKAIVGHGLVCGSSLLSATMVQSMISQWGSIVNGVGLGYRLGKEGSVWDFSGRTAWADRARRGGRGSQPDGQARREPPEALTPSPERKTGV